MSASDTDKRPATPKAADDATAPASSRFAATAADVKTPEAPASSAPERRASDRRQREAPRDASGQVQSENYVGPDRRSGIDRRAYLARQRELVRAEKAAFIQRMVLTFCFFFILIVLAGVFLLAPEYVWLKKRAVELEKVAAQEPVPPVPVAETSVPLGARMNAQIERAGTVTAAARDMLAHAEDVSAAAIATAQQLATADNTGLRALVDFVGGISASTATPEGRAQTQASVAQLKSLLANWNGDAEGLNQAVVAARAQDPHLDSLMTGVTAEDAGAAALLLLMGEFRSAVGEGRPFEQDLSILRRLAGSNPQLQQSLNALAPHAASGVLSRAALQKEFGGLAMDIVAAKVAGQDANIAERAQARLQKLVRVRDAETTDGQSADAVVNRAQALLNKGDINGAIAELQSLQGAQRDAANPFIQQAQGLLAADQSTNALANAIMGQLAAGGGVSLEGLRGLMGGDFGFNSAPVSPVSGQTIAPRAPVIGQ